MTRSFRPLFAAALAAMLLSAFPLRAAEIPMKETKAQRDARMKWWREARFGMFIHWGVYSVPAGTYHGKQIGGIGEWIMNRGKIPVAEYAEFAKQFNPVKFNADQWVNIAKDAGMKYIVITAKHHDGFAMFHSKASPYNIYDATPFKRDPLTELAAACQQAGHQAGLLLFAGPGLAPSRRRTPCRRATGTRPRTATWTSTSDEIAVPQVREILTNYGDVPAVLWWDTPVGMTHARTPRSLAGAAEAAAGHHHQQPPRRRLPGRHGNARAAHSRHRLSRPRLGNLHDDERHLGLQELRPQMEIDRRRSSAT